MWESLYGNVTKEEFKMGQDFGKKLVRSDGFNKSVCLIGNTIGGSALGLPGGYQGVVMGGGGGFLYRTRTCFK
jgi:hypothetical protein